MPAAWGISYKKRIYGMDPDIVPKCFWTVSTYTGRREYEDIVGRDNDIKSVFDAIKNIEAIKDAVKDNIYELEHYVSSNDVSGLISRVNTILSKARSSRRFDIMFYCLVPMISRYFFKNKEECENYIEKYKYSFDVDPKPLPIEFEEEKYG